MSVDGIRPAGPPDVSSTGLDLAGLRGGRGGKSLKELEDAAYKLEGVFMSLLVKKLREGLDGAGLFGSGPGAETYGGLFDQMMGEEFSRRGGLGIAEMVIRSAFRGTEAQGEGREDES